MLVCWITPSWRGDTEALRKEIFQGCNPKGSFFTSWWCLQSNPLTPVRLPCPQSTKAQDSFNPQILTLGHISYPGTFQGHFPPWDPQWNLSQVTLYIYRIALFQSPPSPRLLCMEICPTSMSCMAMSYHSQSWSQAELPLSAIIPLPALHDTTLVWRAG